MGAISADFTVTFDPAVLTPNGVTFGSVGSSNGGGRTINVQNPGAGTMIISIFGGNQFIGSGALVNINFNVVGLPGVSSAIALSSFQYNEGPPCGLLNNGRVEVISGTISGTVTYGNILTAPAPRYVPNVTLSAAGSPPVFTSTDALGTYSLGGFGSGSYTITPTKSGGVNDAINAFDAAQIAQHVVMLLPFNPTQQIVANVSGSDGISGFDATLVARYVVQLPPMNDTTGNWIFNASSNTYPNIFANVSNENYSALLMGDVTGNWNDPISLPGRAATGPERAIAVKAPQMTAVTGQDVTIPIEIQGAPNKGIVAYEFELTYDPKVIQPQANPVTLTNTASRNLTVVANPQKPGSLKVAVFGVTPINENGVLLNLKFTAVGSPGSTSPLIWESLLLNEGNPRVLPVDGQVILSASPNQAEITGRLLTPYGEAISGANVTFTAGNGKSISMLSDNRGSYRFGGLTLGETYTISAASRRWKFTPLTVSVLEQSVNVDLIAEP